MHTDIAELVPQVGQTFYDDFGRMWSVEDVRVLDASPAGEYYCVRMEFRTPDCRVASYVMTPHEFRTLAAKRGLRPKRPNWH